MICFKDKAILFLLGFVMTLQVGMVFRMERLIRTVEAFEPVVIEHVQEIEKATEVAEIVEIPLVTETSEEESEVSEDTSEDVTEEVMKEPNISIEETEIYVVEPVPIRIDCRLDDATQQMILEKCEQYNIDFAFAMAVIFKESSFRPDADSGSSVGLMQINRINHPWLSEELGITDFFDPEQNVTAGLYVLRGLFDKYEDPHKVLMAYNMGSTGAKRKWDKGIYTSAYSEGVLQTAEKYTAEIAERMG